jgi:hypothetical protein
VPSFGAFADALPTNLGARRLVPMPAPRLAPKASKDRRETSDVMRSSTNMLLLSAMTAGRSIVQAYISMLRLPAKAGKRKRVEDYSESHFAYAVCASQYRSVIARSICDEAIQSLYAYGLWIASLRSQ